MAKKGVGGGFIPFGGGFIPVTTCTPCPENCATVKAVVSTARLPLLWQKNQYYNVSALFCQRKNIRLAYNHYTCWLISCDNNGVHNIEMQNSQKTV